MTEWGQPVMMIINRVDAWWFGLKKRVAGRRIDDAGVVAY
jgi:hypothetical protein